MIQKHIITIAIEVEYNYKPRGNQIRQLKSQGTTKIGSQCSAYIKATCNLRTQEVYVQYCRTHYNHSTTLAFLKIPENIRLDIAIVGPCSLGPSLNINHIHM